MDNREKILRAVEKNQPSGFSLKDSFLRAFVKEDPVRKFIAVLKNIGGVAIEVSDWDEIKEYIRQNFNSAKRIVSPVKELPEMSGHHDFINSPHLFSDVDLSIFQAHFGVAENGAAWLTDDRMGDRALPFISQHIALVLRKEDILQTMHEAYDRIGMTDYNFGTFIAGPSKTADIEQSLVLGAHGPKSMTVFIL